MAMFHIFVIINNDHEMNKTSSVLSTRTKKFFSFLQDQSDPVRVIEYINGYRANRIC